MRSSVNRDQLRARHRAFLIRCSYIEIYKEQITDLIGKKALDVHESKAKVRMEEGGVGPRGAAL